MLPLPVSTSDAEVLSVRLGTVTGATLSAYLYRFSTTESKWVEVAQCSTGSSNTAQIFYPSPESGAYVAYVEAYGSSATVYGEIETAVIRSDEVALANVITTVLDGSGGSSVTTRDLQIHGPTNESHDSIAVISGSTLIATLPAETADPTSIPVVQILGGGEDSGPGIATIRAWTPDGRYPLDIVVAVNDVYYQLNRGRVTAWMESQTPVTWRVPYSNTTVRLDP